MKKELGAKALLFPTPVLIVATYDIDGKPNAMTAAWGGICCSSPPCIGISLRKATYTYNNLIETKAFTINIPGKEYVKEADYLGMASGKNEDKFAKTGLTPIRSKFVEAPFVKEFPVNLECKIIHVIDLGLHTQFIGEVLNLQIDEALENESEPLIEQIKPLIFAPGSNNYYTIGDEMDKAFSSGKDIMNK